MKPSLTVSALHNPSRQGSRANRRGGRPGRPPRVLVVVHSRLMLLCATDPKSAGCGDLSVLTCRICEAYIMQPGRIYSPPHLLLGSRRCNVVLVFETITIFLLVGCSVEPRPKVLNAVESNWTDPQALRIRWSQSVPGSSRITSLHVDYAGRLHALLEYQDATGNPPGNITNKFYYLTSDDQVNLLHHAFSEGNGSIDSPGLAVDNQGWAHVLWYAHSDIGSGDATATDLLYRVFKSGAWGSTATIYRGSGGDVQQRVLVPSFDRLNQLHIFHAADEEEVRYLRVSGTGNYISVNVGQRVIYPSWANPLPLRSPEIVYVSTTLPETSTQMTSDLFHSHIQLSDSVARVAVYVNPRSYSFSPQLALDSDGTRHLVWLESGTDDRSPRRLLYTNSRSGSTWSTPQDITPTETNLRVLHAPQLYVDRKSRLHLTFSALGRLHSDRPTYYYMRRSNGYWSTTGKLFASTDPISAGLKTAYDSESRLYAIWQVSDGTFYLSTLDI